MILQRMASAIKRQDWSQIITEILIVVIGIFLGLQVTDWNNERGDRVQENRYLGRIHTEIMEMIPRIDREYASNKDSQKTTAQFKAYLFGDSDVENLAAEHCNSIYEAHIYTTILAAMPTVEELSASGNIAIIESDDLRLLFAKHALALARLEDTLLDIRSDRVVLNRKYPELIQLDLKSDDTTVDGGEAFICDYMQMKNNTSFINDYFDNTARFLGLAIRSSEYRDLIGQTHVELDRLLGISHAEGTT